MKKIYYHLRKVDEAYKEYLKYVGMVRLLKDIFTRYGSGARKTWEDGLLEAINTLSVREQQVLKLRYAIDGEFHTLRETGQHFGVTQERIRQIEAKALRKLKHPSRRNVILGMSWQVAVQDAKARGEELLARHAEASKKEERKPVSYYEVEEIGLPVRVSNALIKAGFETVYDVMKVSDHDLSKVRNMGRVSIRMIREAIEKLQKNES